MFWLDRHRESPSFRLPTDRPHTIYLTLPLGLGLFQRCKLSLGQDQTVLGAPGFQRLEPLVHGLQIAALPYAADAGR